MAHKTQDQEHADEHERKKLKDQIKSIHVDTFTKALVALIMLFALIDLQLSYILAFMDKVQIAEELSKQVCVTIIGVAFVYMIRAYYDSKAEHNNESVKQAMTLSIANKVSSVLAESGIDVNVIDLLNKTEETQNTECVPPTDIEIPVG